MNHKIMLLLLLFLSSFLLTACKEDATPVICFDGFHEEDGKCVEDDPVCFAPSDYETSLTYSLVWSDEFDGTELDMTKWRYEINGDGGGNQEEQYYTGDNTEVSDGTLKIIAKYEDYNGWEYTSSRITTKGYGEFTYGKIEVKAIVPDALGTWSAIWMMPTTSRYGGWPDSGEIDIMEHVGYDLDNIHSTIHTKIYNHPNNSQKGGSIDDFNDTTTAFHVYQVEWLPDRMIFSMDDEHIYTYNPNKFSSCPTYNIWPFNKDFFIILNVAVGGTWGGAQGIDPNQYPSTMEVDYVRVYQAEELIGYDDHTE